jgi:hypothetical protein
MIIKIKINNLMEKNKTVQQYDHKNKNKQPHGKNKKKEHLKINKTTNLTTSKFKTSACQRVQLK